MELEVSGAEQLTKLNTLETHEQELPDGNQS